MWDHFCITITYLALMATLSFLAPLFAEKRQVKITIDTHRRREEDE